MSRPDGSVKNNYNFVIFIHQSYSLPVNCFAIKRQSCHNHVEHWTNYIQTAPNHGAAKRLLHEAILGNGSGYFALGLLCRSFGDEGCTSRAALKGKRRRFRFRCVENGFDKACVGFHVEYCLILVFVYVLVTVMPPEWGGKVAGVRSILDNGWETARLFTIE
jgi:hypothetical protein